MPQQIEVRKLRVQNLVINRKNLNEDQDDPPDWHLVLGCNYTLTGDMDIGKFKETPLTPAQEAALINFLKPRVQALATLEQVDPPDWAAS